MNFPRYKIELTFGAGVTKNGGTIFSSVRDAALEVITEKAVQLFGGFTLYSAEGGWMGPSGVVRESSRTLTIYTEEITGAAMDEELDDKIHELVTLIKSELNQESVAVVTTKAASIKFQ